MVKSELIKFKKKQITLVRSLKENKIEEKVIYLIENLTLSQALDKVGWKNLGLICGIWNKQVAEDTILNDGDRIELYRYLKVDPKIARRERFIKQGSKGTGLFKVRRKNSKAGY